jgi:hypothetical protein
MLSFQVSKILGDGTGGGMRNSLLWFEVVVAVGCGGTASRQAPIGSPHPQVAPSSVSLSPGGTQQFTAASSDGAVLWSVAEGSGGKVDASGVYTAPLADGIYHVVARSHADPTRSAQATVSVKATYADACMQARRAVFDDISNLLTQNASGCSVDVDCIVVETSLPCQEGCASEILTAHQSLFKQEIDQYASRICPTLPVNCGIAPECAPLIGARCMNGICRPVPAGSHP